MCWQKIYSKQSADVILKWPLNWVDWRSCNCYLTVSLSGNWSSISLQQIKNTKRSCKYDMFTYRKLILMLVLHMYVPARNCSLKIQKRLLASYWRKVQQILTHICDQQYLHTTLQQSVADVMHNSMKPFLNSLVKLWYFTFYFVFQKFLHWLLYIFKTSHETVGWRINTESKI